MTLFQTARRRLTGWYLLIILTITFLFSMTLYTFLAREVDRFDSLQRQRFVRRFSEDEIRSRSLLVALPLPDSRLVIETKQRIFWTLVIIDCIIVVIAGGFGYFLAGRHLRPIEDMVEEQQQFVSNSSHELRTPLTSLKAALEVHLRGKRPTLREANELIKESLEDVNKLQMLTDTLLSFSEYQNSVSPPQFEKTSTTEVAEQAIKKTISLAKKKHITLAQKLDNAELFGNKKALVDVLVILIDNAIKYSPKDSTIRIQSFKKQENIFFLIADQGIGIAKKDLSHIFDRFYRADEARSKADGGGFGLGLSIAKQIVEHHHGKLMVESTLHQGTIFTVRLPSHAHSH